MAVTPPGAERQHAGARQAPGPRRLRALEAPAGRPERRLADLVLVDQHEAQGWRARQDERLDTLFEQRCDWNREYGRAERFAVDGSLLSGPGLESLTYAELDARANRLAHYLRLHGASAGDRIALLFADRTVPAYSAMLAVLKIGAAYVPLDAAAPATETAAIIADTRVSAILTEAAVRERLVGANARPGEPAFDRQGPGSPAAEFVVVDEAAPLVAELSPRRLLPAERGLGSTGPAAIVPGGRGGPLAFGHRSLCNAFRVLAEVHGIREDDRIYHGDPLGAGSAEPIWLAWAAGATLVPAPAPLCGRELRDFLAAGRVTVLSCTPTMLATLESDLPDLRVVLLHGEPCPQSLVAGWHRPGRRLVNTYRSRATGTVTHADLRPGHPVTIGVPLPTFTTVILDADDANEALPHGETGEIGVAGIGLAARPLDPGSADEAFVDDFLGIPGNPSGLIYRTGDLGRVTDDGEIEYLGSIGAPAKEPAPGGPVAAVDVAFEQPVAEQSTATEQPGTDPTTVFAVARPAAPRRPAPSPAAAESTTAFPAVARPAAPRRPGTLPAAEPAGRLPTVPRPVSPPVPKPAERAIEEPGRALPAAPAAAPAVATALAEVLAGVLGVEHVSVDANVFDDLGADSMVMTRFCARLRKRADLPTVSIKDVYAHPTVAALAAFAQPPAAPAALPASGAVTTGLAELLASVLGVEHVSVDANVFDDLGADSMVMTRFCARLRKRADLPTVSIKDVYAHPTIAALAAFAAPNRGDDRPGAAEPDPAAVTARIPIAAKPASTAQYLLCGFLQLLIFLGYFFGLATIIEFGYQWISTATTVLEVYLRALEFSVGAFGALCAVPILVKWLLIGRWKPRQIHVWSLGYVRFWIVKTLIRANPVVLLSVGTPLYPLYLRALGAKIGRGVVILTKHLPVCTDLITIGDGTIIRNESYLNGYRAQSGMIQIGSVTLGRGVFVGEKTVLDIDTSMGDGAQLGHTSSLHSGQAVPGGARWHGSPAEPTGVNYRTVEPARVTTLRRAAYVLGQLVKLIGIYLPLGFGGLPLVLAAVPQLNRLLETGPVAFTSRTFYLDALLTSAVLTFGGLVLGLLVTFTVPRLLNLFLTPDRVYPLYGFHYSIQRTITRLTNIKLFTYLFGDSSYIVGYLRGLGYDLGKVEQTGSNFGSAVTHDTPFLARVGTGTVVADGLHFINADYSNTSFRVSRVSIGARSFLGNHIAYPAQGRTGDNCLLATKVMVPIDGKVREGVGLLGSPSFEIPRSVQRDIGLEVRSRDELRRRLRAKNRHNLVTLALALVARWLHVLGTTVLAMLALDVLREVGPLAFAVQATASLLFTFSYFVLVERIGAGFRRLRPKSCSIYDRAFWRHERYWKLVLPEIEKALAGTPFINIVTRALGLRLGKRVFDDGAAKTERTLTAIGDDCMLNEGSILQCHSQEDGAFKSDHSSLGARVTIGVGALVHYGVTVGDGAILAPDSFLMKGEEVPPSTYWGGNPARELDTVPAPAPPALAGRAAHHVSTDNRGAVLAAATA